MAFQWNLNAYVILLIKSFLVNTLIIVTRLCGKIEKKRARYAWKELNYLQNQKFDSIILSEWAYQILYTVLRRVHTKKLEFLQQTREGYLFFLFLNLFLRIWELIDWSIVFDWLVMIENGTKLNSYQSFIKVCRNSSALRLASSLGSKLLLYGK